LLSGGGLEDLNPALSGHLLFGGQCCRLGDRKATSCHFRRADTILRDSRGLACPAFGTLDGDSNGRNGRVVGLRASAAVVRGEDEAISGRDKPSCARIEQRGSLRSLTKEAGLAVVPTRVWLVDDDRDLQEILQICLKQWGFEVAIASDGGGGARLAESYRPDI